MRKGVKCELSTFQKVPSSHLTPFTFIHAALIPALPALPALHCDPFDRILLALAMSESLRLITADKILAKYSDLIELV